MFALQNRIDKLTALNSKLDILLQSQMYSMPFKGHHELLKWEFENLKLNISCVHLSTYISKLEIIYKDETAIYEPKNDSIKSIFHSQRPTKPLKFILHLNTHTMVLPVGNLKEFMDKAVCEQVGVSIAFIQSIIVQYAVAHSLLQDNIIQCDATLKKIFKRDSVNFEQLDSIVVQQTRRIEPIEIDIDGNNGGICYSYRNIHYGV